MIDPLQSIWTEKYRPKTLEDIVLSPRDLKLLQSFRDTKSIPNLLFSGNPGTGKTSTAKIICKELLECQYLYINASDENGIDTVRGTISSFVRSKSLDGHIKVVLLDECDAITPQGMAALRAVMEEYADNCRFILTCNYLFKVIPAIQSRCQHIDLCPPVPSIAQRIIKILHTEQIKVPEQQKPLLLELIQRFAPDIRRIINEIQKHSYSGELTITGQTGSSLAQQIIEKIFQGSSIHDLRAFIIKNEASFSKDYLGLLRDLFEEVFSSSLIPQKHCSNCLLMISEAMRHDALVVDKEINAFALVIFLHQTLTSHNNAE